MKMKGEGGEGTSESYPLLLHRLPFHLRKFFFYQEEGDSRDWGLPFTPLHRQPRHPKKWEYRL